MIHEKPKQGFGYVYKYTSPSGKSYIGQTIDSLYKRAGGPNGKRYKTCPIFYKAIQKYGFKNFEVEILATVPQNQLNDTERKYIEIFNTQIPNGYNVSNGGNAQGTKKVYQYDSITGAFLAEFASVIDAAKAIGREAQGIVDCTHGRKLTCGGYCWSLQKLKKYPIYEKIEITEYNVDKKQVQMFDLNGQLLRTFTSIAEAASYCDGERSAIRRCCRHELKTHKGYKWECGEIIAEKKYNNTAVSIEQIDIQTGVVIAQYSSISAAARALGKNGTTLLRRVLDDDQATAYGYRWRRAQSSTTIGPLNR